MEKMGNDLQNTSTQFVRDENMSKTKQKFCSACKSFLTLDNFYHSKCRGLPTKSSFCIEHTKERARKAYAKKIGGIKRKAFLSCEPGPCSKCSPDKELPASAFYARENGRRYGVCKDCRKYGSKLYSIYGTSSERKLQRISA